MFVVGVDSTAAGRHGSAKETTRQMAKAQSSKANVPKKLQVPNPGTIPGSKLQGSQEPHCVDWNLVLEIWSLLGD
jgi:hypothetical protein